MKRSQGYQDLKQITSRRNIRILEKRSIQLLLSTYSSEQQYQQQQHLPSSSNTLRNSGSECHERKNIVTNETNTAIYQEKILSRTSKDFSQGLPSQSLDTISGTSTFIINNDNLKENNLTNNNLSIGISHPAIPSRIRRNNNNSNDDYVIKGKILFADMI